ncbi:MAG: ASKHA domain-containing protein [Eubacteriales bacterium]
MGSAARECKVILEERTKNKVKLDPLTKKFFLNVEPPRLGYNQADTDRLRDALYLAGAGRVEVPLPLMRDIPKVCREKDWSVTATVGQPDAGAKIVALEPGDTTGRHFGLAIDVGTTTVVAYLVDMNTGETIGTSANYNGQVSLGEDILTRIYLAATADGLASMQIAVVSTINNLVLNLTERFEIEPAEVGAAVVGANSTMVHLLLGLDPKMICREPYTPVVNNTGFLKAGDIGININPNAVLYCLPGVGSYVGGDVVAGVLVSGMHRSKEVSLLVDIGTNGEMVLGNGEWLTACAGAAGPALEGGVAHSGICAGPGAIDLVRIDPKTSRVSYRTIGGEKPRGICGSGLIDCLAGFLLAGIIDRSGYFRGGLSSFNIVPASQSATGEEISVSQLDINNFMRTKGAVNAALETMLESVGVPFSALGKFYAAGAFGMHLDLESSITIGLYPDLPRDKMVRLGNSSGEGARLVLLSNQKRLEAEEIAGRVTYFELNANQEFMNKFVGSKFLPHTNLDYFPTVKAMMVEMGLLEKN